MVFVDGVFWIGLWGGLRFLTLRSHENAFFLLQHRPFFNSLEALYALLSLSHSFVGVGGFQNDNIFENLGVEVFLLISCVYGRHPPTTLPK